MNQKIYFTLVSPNIDKIERFRKTSNKECGKESI